MTVRLLLDENLSERVLRSLDKIFPGSTHVRNLGGEGASDRQVWDLAKTGGFILTTRDEDFVGMSVLRGAPPKVVWLNVGNARNDAIVSLLRANADEIAKFSVHEEHTFLAIGEVAGASK